MEAPANPAFASHDPRGQYDDPLLDSLLTLCELQQKPSSRAMLTNGLPLPAQPDQFANACMPHLQPTKVNLIPANPAWRPGLTNCSGASFINIF